VLRNSRAICLHLLVPVSIHPFGTAKHLSRSCPDKTLKSKCQVCWYYSHYLKFGCAERRGKPQYKSLVSRKSIKTPPFLNVSRTQIPSLPLNIVTFLLHLSPAPRDERLQVVVSAFCSFATFFLNSLFFSLSAKPSGCLCVMGSATCTFPSPPLPTWKFSFSVLGRRATSGMTTSSFLLVALRPGEPMLAAPPRPLLKAPSPWSPTTPSRTISPSPYLDSCQLIIRIQTDMDQYVRETYGVLSWPMFPAPAKS